MNLKMLEYIEVLEDNECDNCGYPFDRGDKAYFTETSECYCSKKCYKLSNKPLISGGSGAIL